LVTAISLYSSEVSTWTYVFASLSIVCIGLTVLTDTPIAIIGKIPSNSRMYFDIPCFIMDELADADGNTVIDNELGIKYIVQTSISVEHAHEKELKKLSSIQYYSLFSQDLKSLNFSEDYKLIIRLPISVKKIKEN
tara:strand:+ start:587 stop:994 length:408 start_codon:yes stop_codon:yes gene_type:complete